MNFNFVAGNNLNFKDFSDFDKFVSKYADFQTVTLSDEKELKFLLELMGITEFIEHEFHDSVFSKYWDLSAFKLPELSEIEFDNFCKGWLSKSGRDNNMDNYGNLIFLEGLSSKWNKFDHRLVVLEI